VFSRKSSELNEDFLLDDPLILVSSYDHKRIDEPAVLVGLGFPLKESVA
jgi:hypothetical protein